MQAFKSTTLSMLACGLLFVALAVTPVAAKDNWTKVRTKNFMLVGNASEKDIRQVGTRLEQFREVFARLFSGARLNTYIPTTVVVFKNFDSYKPFRSGNAIGYFQPGEDVNYITLTTEQTAENPYRVIFHEFVHLLVENNMTSDAPAWFNEGLAEYYSTFEMREGDKLAVLGLRIANHVLYLREQKLIPLPTLFAVDNSSPYYNESDKQGVFYAESWALVHYFLLGGNEARKQQFGRYLDLLGKGVSAQESFKQVFAGDTPALERELKKYIGQSSYMMQTSAFDKPLTFDAAMQSAPMPEAEAQAYLGDLLLHTHRLEAVEPYLQRAVALDENLSMAHASLGMLRVKQGRFNEAKQSLERAVKINTQNYLVHFYYADALVHEQTGATGLIQAFSKETAQAVRTHLKRAIELAPEFPESYNELAFVNMMTNEQLDESVNLVGRAMALAPGRHDYALTLAQVQMRRGDLKAAHRILEALDANVNADAGVRAEAKSLLEAVAHKERDDEELAEVDNTPAEQEARDNKRRSELRLRKRGDEEKPETKADDSAIQATLEQPAVSTLRPRREGEEQLRGLLLRVECLPKSVFFHIKVGERVMRLTNTELNRVEIVTYTPDMSGEFTCGPRNPPNHVLVTFHPPKDARAKTDGEIIALDFIPKDWK